MKTIKKLFYIVYIIVTLLIVGILGVVIYGAIYSDFKHPDLINSISLYIAFFSLPGIVITLLSLVPENKRKAKIHLKGQCPKCYSEMNYYLDEQ
ncbi:hypothetical protein [Ornithinibacillus halotolerans]|uniref:Uncharacterized protein n=1 Tax=Ornithinibacillus halotolerans TaxID=1274357 RepID=A0A916W4G9_9BACI|nr:hypothetical protein [Ornithinibacillus halotolerans]GGA65214.1 hypothetical protein GCM10008025_06340 [Ornithinibacillus halotolerans]